MKKEELEKMIDLSDEAFLLLSKEGVIEKVNDTFLQIYGFRHKDEVVGESIELIGSRKGSYDMKEISEELERQEYIIRHRKTKGKNKNIFVKEKIGRFDGKIFIFQYDETGYKKRSKKIVEKQKDLKKFERAVEGSFDHIIMTDAKGTIIYANQGVERVTGFSREEVIGKNPSLWGGIMGREVYEKMWRRIKEQKKPYIGELKNRKKNGEVYYADVRISPILNNKGEVEFFIGIERDVTEERKVEEAKTEFVSIASHQLRTPLSAINWYTEMIMEKYSDALGEKPKKYIGEIRDAGKKMNYLVNALLQASRLELGTVAVEPQRVDLIKVMEEAWKDLFVEIEEKELSVEKKYPEEGIVIESEPRFLDIVFQNIFSNAVKYSEKKGSIKVNLERTDDEVRIEVADEGVGIPYKQKEEVFKKLFRAENVKERGYDGTGLGLYIAKKMIEEMNGGISFESPDPHTGRGTVFYIDLPLSGIKRKEGKTI